MAQHGGDGILEHLYIHVQPDAFGVYRDRHGLLDRHGLYHSDGQVPQEREYGQDLKIISKSKADIQKSKEAVKTIQTA